MRYEKLSSEPQPSTEDLAFLYHDDGGVMRKHYVCYCVSAFDQPRRYVVAHMASEDTDFYDYHGAPPEERGLLIHSVYRVHDSYVTTGYDQDHIILCFTDKSIEFAGQVFDISESVEGSDAASILANYVWRSHLVSRSDRPGATG